MDKLSKKFKFSISMRNDELIKEGRNVKNAYLKAARDLEKLRRIFEEYKKTHKDNVYKLKKTEFIFRVAERKHRMQDLARCFTVALSFGYVPYELVKNTVFLKFIAFNKQVLTTKVMTHGGIMDAKTKTQFRKGISKMKDEGYLGITHKEGVYAFYYLTQKGKEEAEVLLHKMEKVRIL